MSNGRPEILFPLFGDLKRLDGVGPKTESLLSQIGIEYPKDLLQHLPSSVIDRRLRSTIRGLIFPTVATVEVLVGLHQPPRTKGRPYRILVQDPETEFQLVFFHAREDWLKRQLPSGQRRVVSGKIELFDGIGQMPHPDHILTRHEAEKLPEFEPVYPLVQGINQKTMNKATSASLSLLPEMDEWIDPNLMTERAWPSWHESVRKAHNPTSTEDVSPDADPRKRLAYDEFFAHQLTLAIARSAKRKSAGVVTKGDQSLQNKVLSALPFSPTGAQLRAVEDITSDMAEPLRMNRLLQGDVGSGKTLVALLSALAAVEAGGQAAIMAPTEILARQHFAALQPLAEKAHVTLEVLTGRDKGDERSAKLNALSDGKIQITVGTHALFQQDVAFSDLRLAVVDEQHRFGVRQRMDLSSKGEAVDVLVMTATPIPRSLELAHYGDMDVSILDEKPAGRAPIDTVLVSASRLDEVTERLKLAIGEGRQAYWVCPLVSESEVFEATAAEERFKSLRAAFGDNTVELVHGQMPPTEKDQAMAKFASGDAKLLVATTVIEVGVDVPNASIMVIEGAEKFGLSQLHQLRGRVGRGSVKSTCLLMYSGQLGDTAMARLKIMRETDDGFKIAEEDLRLRGAGDVLGVAQSGLPRFRIADPETQTELMRTAQKDARSLLESDPKLTSNRGEAAKVLLYLMDQDKAFQMISVG